MQGRWPRLVEVTLPDFGEPTTEPALTVAIYEARLERVRTLMAKRGLDALVVYGDREHSANIAYVSGHDPRFEEALLVIAQNGTPHLLLGNEGWGYAALAKGSFERVLYQPLSLMGQPRDQLRPFAELLREAGLNESMAIGTAGWKGFDIGHGRTDPDWFEVPAFLVDALKGIAGERGTVVNAIDLLMNPDDGLRAINEADQLAMFEYAATIASNSVRRVLFGAKPGMSEYQAVQLMKLNGLPWSVHLMLSGGNRARYGLPSPSMRKLKRGEPFTVAFGIAGALNCRAGFLVEDQSELPDQIRDYVEKLVSPYFRAVVAWYETVGLNVTGGEVFEAVHQYVGDRFFGVGLNPGHLIHLDEWVHSPIFKDSMIRLKAGMALQLDIIPATGTSYFTSNVEDGIALADKRLRDELASRYPEAWSRIERRRNFMQEALGIRLKSEVLPFSNIPAYLPPFILSPRRVMSMA